MPGNVHPLFAPLLRVVGGASADTTVSPYLNRPTRTFEEASADCSARLAKHVVPAKSEDRNDASMLLGSHQRMVAAAADGLHRLKDYEDTLTENLCGWFHRLGEIEREMKAARIILEAGYGIGVPLPDDAEPYIQALIHCREHLPSPTYDDYFVVRVRQGRAFIEGNPLRGVYDKHYQEWVAGAPFDRPTPFAGDAA